MDANTQVKDRNGKMPIDHVNLVSNIGRSHLLIFALKELVPCYPNFVFGISYRRKIQEPVEIDLKFFDERVLTPKNESAWLHIPWTNGVIVFAILRRLEQQSGLPDGEFSYSSWFRDPAVVAGNQDLNYRMPSYESNFGKRPNVHTPGPWFPYVSIVFPFIALRTKTSQRLARLKTSGSRAAVTNGFARSVIRFERTLDETYYPSLSAEALEARNEDQVVSREWVEIRDPDSDDGDPMPILMVPQLWIWRLHDHIVTASPTEGLLPGKDAYGEDVEFDRNVGSTESQYFKDMEPKWMKWDSWYTGIQIGIIIARHITAFGESQAGGRFKSPLDIFERGVVRVLLDVEAYMDPNRPSRPIIEEEREFMHRITDIREELAMIQEILGQQREILERLIQDYEHYNPDSLSFMDPGQDIRDPNAKWEIVKSSGTKLRGYQKRVDRIDKDAERIERVIQDQLSLKRTHASISDARSGLILSAAVAGLTIITIIFTPLAFMASLFALPLDRLLSNQFEFNRPGGTDDANGTGSTAAYTTKYIAKWFTVVEFVSLATTSFLVALCLWFFGGTEILTAIWETHSRKTGIGRRTQSTIGEDLPDFSVVRSKESQALYKGIILSANLPCHATV
ncbi:uncharacterized protein F4822DRAFT_90190 [Hypoxylon trugodes]|uniref:uncharacterized protein n=1 Tax=Hypoxylon trugodes TaxID=326681 RepID=UPI00219EB98C|nr:uncharacterized protein F4822DRAFT_90190 [Hypoxylon trugodes]KAI1383028.1 hypothetical protein F4822DRAFT_90190 [Hypoxylon trugodes]